MPRPISKKTKATAEPKIPTGTISFQSEAKLTNNTNKKLDRKINKDSTISCIRVSMDKEKIKSYDFKIGLKL